MSETVRREKAVVIEEEVDDLAADNSTLRQQSYEWRGQRAQNGEDSTDYQAFRRQVIDLTRRPAFGG